MNVKNFNPFERHVEKITLATLQCHFGFEDIEGGNEAGADLGLILGEDRLGEADGSTAGGEDSAGAAHLDKEVTQISDKERHLFGQGGDGAITPLAGKKDRLFRAHPAKPLEQRLRQGELRQLGSNALVGCRLSSRS